MVLMGISKKDVEELLKAQSEEFDKKLTTQKASMDATHKALERKNAVLTQLISDLNTTLSKQTGEIEMHSKNQTKILSSQLSSAVNEHLKSYDNKESEIYAAVKALKSDFDMLLNNQKVLNGSLNAHEEVLNRLKKILLEEESTEYDSELGTGSDGFEELRDFVTRLEESMKELKKHTQDSLGLLGKRMDNLTPLAIAEHLKTQLKEL